MSEVERLENFKKEIEWMRMDVLRINEVRRPEENYLWSGEYRIINTAGERDKEE